MEKEKLRSLVDRIERLNEEKAAIVEDTKGVYAEAKAGGFNTKALKRLIAERARNQADLEAENELLDLYRRALESFDNTPLAQAADNAATGAAASPAVKRAVKKFKDAVDKTGGSVTITAGGGSVTIGKNSGAPAAP